MIVFVSCFVTLEIIYLIFFCDVLLTGFVECLKFCKVAILFQVLLNSYLCVKFICHVFV